MNSKEKVVALCGAVFLLVATPDAPGATNTGASRVPVLRLNSERNTYILKVGHADYGSYSNVTSSSAFTNLVAQLKKICGDSPRGSSLGRHTNFLRAIDVDLAIGSDYQVFDWLVSGRIDAAVISPLALRLHRLWASNAVEFVSFDALDGPNWSFLYEPRIRSFNLPGRIPRANPEADYLDFLKSILDDPTAQQPYRLIAPSHLSTAGFIAPLTYANKWLTNSNPPRASAEAFWKGFFTHLDLTLSRTVTNIVGPNYQGILIEFSSDPGSPTEHDTGGWSSYTNLQHVTVPTAVRRLIIRSDVAQRIAVNSWPGSLLVATNVDPTVRAMAADETLREFLQPNFRLTELARLIRADQETSGKEDLALVLSGGGVKAAYQSALIDRLYGARILGNQSNSASLHVKSIVGNSGGALLGYFVAGLRPGDKPNLSEILWKPGGKLMTDRNIFGNLDLLRWASFVVCIWIFVWTLRLFALVRGSHRRVSGFLAHRKGAPSDPATSREEVPAARRYSLARRYWFGLAAVLILTPWLFQVVNGLNGMEHIPAIQGIFYFVFLFLVMLIDNCLTPPNAACEDSEDTEMIYVPSEWSRPSFPPTPPALLAAAGLVIALVPVILGWAQGAEENWVTKPVGETITIGGIILSTGLTIFWIGVIWRLGRRTKECVFRGWRDFIKAVALGLAVIGLAYFGLWIAARNDMVTFLELTPGFWTWLVGLTALISTIIYIFASREDCPPRLRRLSGIHSWIRNGMVFQLAKHPSQRFGLTRLVRMHLIFTAGFLYWNLLVAPALYGNANARAYLDGVAGKFSETNEYELQTLYAAPANDLARDRERYFVFAPSNRIDFLKAKLGNDPRKRWTAAPFQREQERQKEMRDVIFASGSPFPIFSPHRVLVDGEHEWLVDGGFVHNVPLEAAKEIGARQVLLLNSSPDDTLSVQEESLLHQSVFGQLIRGLPHLLPFLFNRSQVADFLMREQMFVVSISPRKRRLPVRWPALFDFRKSVVRYLLQAAEEDQQQRIGRIETPGPPEFLFSIRMGRDQEGR